MKPLTIPQIAYLLSISEYTAMERCRTGKVPGAKKQGKRWLAVPAKFATHLGMTVEEMREALANTPA